MMLMFTIEILEKQLEILRRFLWACSGASLALLVTAIVERRNVPNFPTWYVILLSLLIVITFSAGLMLLLTHKWRQLPLRERLNPAIGFIGIAWITLASVVVRFVSLIPPRPIWITVMLGVVLGMSYLLLLRQSAEETFP